MDKYENYKCAFLLCLCKLITLVNIPKVPIHRGDIRIYDKTALHSGSIVVNEV